MSRRPPGRWLCSRHRGGCRTPSGSFPGTSSPVECVLPAPSGAAGWVVPGTPGPAGPKMAAAAKMEEAVRGPRSHPQLRAPARGVGAAGPRPVEPRVWQAGSPGSPCPLRLAGRRAVPAVPPWRDVSAAVPPAAAVTAAAPPGHSRAQPSGAAQPDRERRGRAGHGRRLRLLFLV